MICIKCKKDVPDGLFCAQCGARQGPPTKKATRRANGLGCARKVGRTWTGIAAGTSYSEIQPDGSVKLIRKRPEKRGFRTKAEALKWAASMTPDEAQPAPKLADLWSAYLIGDYKKLSTDRQSAAKKAHDRLAPLMGRRIDTLTVLDLQTCVDEAAPSHYTARDMRTVLSKLYQLAMAQQQVSINLSQFITLPELEEREAEPFEPDEVTRMWTAWREGNVFIGYVLLMIYTGMMPSELLACRKDQIDLDACEIFGCGKKTKRRKEVSIIFPDFLRPVIEILMTQDSDNSRADHGKLIQMNKWAFYERYHEALKALGVRDLPPYSCRHTFGTEAVKGQNSPEVVRQMLRHSTILTQQRYTHITQEAAREAINRLKHG